jgi:uncharacterized protein
MLHFFLIGMPTNVSPDFQKAEKEYLQAEGLPDKIKGLQKMLSTLNKHKGTENLEREIKQRLSKYKALLEKEKLARKGKGGGLSIKRDGSAQVVLIGKTNSGKSYLLSKITNASPLVADYEFSTKLPEIGTMLVNEVPIQIIEIPAIVENFMDKEKGPMFLGIIRGADLIVILAEDKKEEKFINHELELAGIKGKRVVVRRKEDPFHTKNKIWSTLGLIYVFTKTPGKEKDYPPIALKKGDCVRDLAAQVHKDFIKKFNFARVWGKSAKHRGMKCGMKHILKSGDIVELHTK